MHPPSLNDLSAFIKVTSAGLSGEVQEGDYQGLVAVMKHLLAVKAREPTTDGMFEPLKQTIEVLQSYGQELSEEVHQQLEVCVCVYVCVCVCMYCLCVHACMCICMCVCMCSYMCACMCVHGCVGACVDAACMKVCMCVCVCVCGENVSVYTCTKILRVYMCKTYATETSDPPFFLDPGAP